MTSLAKFGLLLALLFQIIIQQQNNVEGFDWLGEGIIGPETMKEAVNLLEKLSHISNIDSVANEIVDKINRISTKIDDFKNVLKSNYRGKVLLTKFEQSRFNENLKEIKSRYNRMKGLSHIIEMNETTKKEEFSELNVLPGIHSVSSIIHNAFFEYFGLPPGMFPEKTPPLDMVPTEFQGGDTNNEMFSIKTPLLDMISLEFLSVKKNNKCLSTSAQQYFFSDYLELILIGIKAYLISKFSWNVLGHKHLTSFEDEEEKFLREHDMRLAILNFKFSEVMSDASMEIRTCDPPHWEEGVNYEQLTRLIQGYIVNEMNLNTFHSCSQNCEYYKDASISCYQGDKYCQENRAEGNVVSCEADGKNTDILVCPSKSRARRLEYFESLLLIGKTRYGKNSSCQQRRSARSFLTGFVFCTVCFCLIDEKSDKSDRFFNLREVVSDVDENKVVTGIRFLKKNRIMYLQIQQGVLGPVGFIKKNTIGWKNVEEYELNEQNDGVDYFTFDSKQRSIDLGEIQMLNTSYVVTGVKLSVVNSRLYLKVRFTESDFQIGKLVETQKSSVWVTDYFVNKDKLPLWRNNEAPKVSTLAPGKNVPSAGTQDYVEFTYSNKRTDASQTTLPFFDIQDVVSDSPTSLSGIGLYYRGFDGYGGFIAPKIFTSHISQFVY